MSYEFENVSTEVLDRLANVVPLYPNTNALHICQNREREKAFLKELSQEGGYFRITRTTSSLNDLVDGLKKLDRHAFDQQVFETYEEKFQWPLLAGLFLLAFLGILL